jgi:hypothetical protein
MRLSTALLLLAVACGALSPSPFDDAVFDRRVWLQQDGSVAADNPRGPMLYDITQRVIPPGTPKSDVELMLGPPDLDDGWTRSADQWRYNVGMWSGMGVDYDTLDVQFRDGAVIDVRRSSHFPD